MRILIFNELITSLYNNINKLLYNEVISSLYNNFNINKYSFNDELINENLEIF